VLRGHRRSQRGGRRRDLLNVIKFFCNTTFFCKTK
jgi:hypothetical protein